MDYKERLDRIASAMLTGLCVEPKRGALGYEAHVHQIKQAVLAASVLIDEVDAYAEMYGQELAAQEALGTCAPEGTA